MNPVRSISSDDRGNVRVELAGDIDASNQGDIVACLRTRMPNTAHSLMIDLSDVSYIDSAGARMLIDLHRRLSRRQQNLQVVSPASTHTGRLLRMMGLDGALNIIEEP